MTTAAHGDPRRSGSRSAPRSTLHPRTLRAARLFAAVAVLVAVTGYVVSRGASAPLIVSADAGAWLFDTSVGAATHVNGLSGIADGEVSIPGSGSGGVAFGRQGENAIAVDATAGRLGLIDPAGQSFSWVTRTTPRAIVSAGAAAVYAAEPGDTTVRLYNARDLSPEGSFALPAGAAPLSARSMALDGSGTLWVADQQAGEVIPVGPHGAGRGLRVAPGGDALVLSATTGASALIVLDDTRGVATEVSGGRVLGSVPLGVPGRTATLALGSAADPAEVPVLRTAGTACDLEVADVPAHSVSTLRLRGTGACDGLLAPVSESERVYVPDDASGRVDVYGAVGPTPRAPVDVTGASARLDVFALDGQVWANDPAGPDAVVIGPSGMHRIDKYDIPSSPATGASIAPGATSIAPSTLATTTSGPTGSAEPAPTSGHLPNTGALARISSVLQQKLPSHPSPTAPSIQPSTSAAPSSGSSPSRSGSSPSPSGTASGPGPLGLTATSGPGYVDLTITPPPGLGPATYRIRSNPPVTVTQTGPTTFRAATPLCLTNYYAFQAIATTASGAELDSDQAEAFGCVPPGPVSDFTLTGLNGSVDVNWSPPAAPGTSVDQLAYIIVWLYDNNASGGPYGSAQDFDPTPDSSGGFAYQIADVPLGVHVIVGIEAENGSGFNTSAELALETTAWDLSACASSATTCAYNDTDPVPLDGAPGTTPTGTALPATPTGDFGVPVTVHCQTTGPTVTLSTAMWLPSDIWDEISYDGATGYVSDLYVSTENSMLATATPQYSACT